MHLQPIIKSNVETISQFGVGPGPSHRILGMTHKDSRDRGRDHACEDEAYEEAEGEADDEKSNLPVRLQDTWRYRHTER